MSSESDLPNVLHFSGRFYFCYVSFFKLLLHLSSLRLWLYIRGHYGEIGICVLRIHVFVNVRHSNSYKRESSVWLLLCRNISGVYCCALLAAIKTCSKNGLCYIYISTHDGLFWGLSLIICLLTFLKGIYKNKPYFKLLL